MPPPMPNPTKRMTANPARPVARYRPGKVTQQEESSEEEEEDEEEEQIQAQRTTKSRPAQSRPKAPLQQDNVEDDDEDGFVTDEDEDEHTQKDAESSSKDSVAVLPKPASTLPLTRPLHPSNARLEAAEHEGEKEEDDDDDDDVDESEEESSSEQEDTSSEEEAPRRKFQRPTFIKKSIRDAAPSEAQATTSATASASTVTATRAAATGQSSTGDDDEQLRRRAQAELLIQDKLEKDAMARAAGKKSWDDDDDVQPEHQVDDTDGLDPESEHQAWKLRELKRLKRDREALELREREMQELDRRRNLTADERDREDAAFIANQRAERDESRSQPTYLARYHHKGAFFQNDETAEVLKKRDVMGARFADEVQDKSVLPEYMRVRDMTNLGKKGRTRYTDLKGQDTGKFGDDVKRWRGAGDNQYHHHHQQQHQRDTNLDTRFVDERFRPDADGRRAGHDGGANRSDYSRRRASNGSRSRSPRPRRNSSRDVGDSYRSRRMSYSRSRSRSHTPPRRKRSPSPYDDRDKRRRINA